MPTPGGEAIDKQVLIVALQESLAAGKAHSSTDTTHDLEVAIRKQKELEALCRHQQWLLKQWDVQHKL